MVFKNIFTEFASAVTKLSPSAAFPTDSVAALETLAPSQMGIRRFMGTDSIRSAPYKEGAEPITLAPEELASSF